MPKNFGDFRVVHTRHKRWSKRGPWQRGFEILATEANNECGQIDSTIVHFHRHKSSAKKVSVTSAEF
ncbi:MAG: hypothetical protein VW701_16800 [Deltaproteobacteria bacterium]